MDSKMRNILVAGVVVMAVICGMVIGALGLSIRTGTLLSQDADRDALEQIRDEQELQVIKDATMTLREVRRQSAYNCVSFGYIAAESVGEGERWLVSNVPLDICDVERDELDEFVRLSQDAGLLPPPPFPQAQPED